jgi:hypothetical protein
MCECVMIDRLEVTCAAVKCCFTHVLLRRVLFIAMRLVSAACEVAEGATEIRFTRWSNTFSHSLAPPVSLSLLPSLSLSLSH